MTFTFVDLFAGIGGFHGALSALGGKAVYASEIDPSASAIYFRNWGLLPDGDITLAANDIQMLVPAHDVLVGGFPCQPFSKSGKQKGMDETRGTLFWNIAKIIEKRRPKIVILENVRNLAGPRHEHEWEVIIRTLRDLGYRVSSHPFVASPHRIHPDFGGRPQIRERIFIAATLVGKKNAKSEPAQLSFENVTGGWDPKNWDLHKHLPVEKLNPTKHKQNVLTSTEILWLEAWDEFLQIIRGKNTENRIPSFPIWADSWVVKSNLRFPPGTPEWKKEYLRKNSELYTSHKKALDSWLKKWNYLRDFPPSRRKFEWQAQDAKSLWECILHFRPSGIRVKKATYAPALVAITQTSILGKQRRRLTVREAARLQGLPEWFSFEGQSDSNSFRQLGNGVNISVVYHVMRALVERDKDLLVDSPKLIYSVLNPGDDPRVYLEKLSKKSNK